MCGIVGLIEPFSKKVDYQLLKSMNDTIIHRGPDEDGFFIHKNVGLAMRRLKIIDLTGGSQPIYNENKNVVVIFNGEIYNYIELREELEKSGHIFSTNTDTEVIAHAYEQYGIEKMMQKFRGMFAFALFDLNSNKLFIARDRFGIKPLYYLLSNGRFYFASEIKAILKDSRVRREFDLTALNHYLTLDYVPTPYTMFSNIKKLEPGCYIEYDTEKAEFSKKRYWQLQVKKREKIVVAELIEEFEEVFKDTIRIMLRSDVPLGVFLSSGLDSTTIAAFIAKHFNSSINTFTAKFQEASYDEAPMAKLLADMYGTQHHEIEIRPEPEKIIDDLMNAFDEPNADYGAIPFYYICKEARPHLTVVFTGNGGDEIFAGYPILLAYKIARIYRKIPRAIRDNILYPLIFSFPTTFKKGSWEFRAKRFVKGFSEHPAVAHMLWKGIFDIERKKKLVKPEVHKQLFSEDTAEIFKQYFDVLKTEDVIWKLMNIDINTFLLDDNIALADRVSMLHSLEVRVPFLDHKVVEFAASIPSSLLLKGFTTKYFLRKAVAKYLPNKLLKLKKQGFTPPLPVWLRTSLKDFMLSILSRDNINQIGIFNYDYIEKLMLDHIEGRQNNNRELWGLITLVLWYKKYM